MLKKYLTVALAFSVAVCVSAQKVVFDSVNVDVGTTLWKKPVTATFKFKNKERTPLRIEKVDAMCGCIVSEWPDEPIRRNDEGEIKVTYDAMTLHYHDGAKYSYDNYDPNGFFGAIWPENTGVFVVSVDAEESGISTGMTLNADLNKNTSKEAGTALDAANRIGRERM